MQVPPKPANEKLRLKTLRGLGLLDTAPEARFDRLTRLAKHLFDVPIALVSFVDDTRQWFKSRQGLEACETPRDVSFCAHAIHGDDVVEVVDASEDPRFAENPLVTGAPHIRFYAGAPLISSEGHGLGTLCVIDRQPRRLNADERLALRDLADLVMLEIEQAGQRERNRDLRAAKQLADVIARAQAKFINGESGQGAFDELLDGILKLTDSEYGVIAETRSDGDEEVSIHSQSCRNIAGSPGFEDANNGEEAAFRTLEPWLGAVLVENEPVIANEPARDSPAAAVVAGPLHLRAFLGIPIQLGSERVATLGIANARTGYDEQVITFLTPLVSTIGQLLSATRLVHRHHDDQLLLRRLSRVARETTNGVVITNPAGQVEWINEGFTRLTGYRLSEMLGRKPGDLLQGVDTNPETVATIRDALASTEGFEVDLLNYHRSGNTYWVRIQCTPLMDEHGRLEGYMAIESDISEAKRALEALNASETRLRGLFALSPIGIALNDYATGDFVDLNEALLKPTGYTREEFVSLSYWDVTPKEYEEQEMQQLETMERTGRYGPFEKEYIRKDGSRYPVLLNGIVVYDSSGRKLIWSIIEDISERKRIERMKNEFISTVSHELRTPLTSISGSLGLLKGGAAGDLPDTARELLDIAHNNSQRLGLLINDLLDMEKLVAGKMRFVVEAQLLSPLLEQAIRDNQGYADRFGVSLVLEATDGEARVEVDADRLQQVLANLLSNAAKFSPGGSDVVLSAMINKDKVRVSVADRGPGIPEEFRDRIFQKFSQADASDTRDQPGTGLGLAISRELVEKMGGRIGFESVPGDGATFYVDLPLAEGNPQK